MVVLMMRNGLIDPNHQWRLMGRRVGSTLWTSFFGHVLPRKRRRVRIEGSIQTLDLLGSPPIGSEKLLDDQEERSG